MTSIIVIIVCIVLLYILLKIYFEKYDNAVGYTGGLGSGKTLRAVSMSCKLLSRNRTKRNWLNFKTWVYNLFHRKYKREYIKEKPMLYSSIPVFIRTKKRYFKNCNVVELKESYYKKFDLEKYISYENYLELKIDKHYVKKFIESSIELKAEHILLQKKIDRMSITFIDELGGFCSQYEYNNPNAQLGLDEFVRLYRHYTMGGYLVFTDQCSENFVKFVRVRLNKVFNLNNFRKFFCFYKVNIREISISEEIKTIEENNKEDNEKHTWGILPLTKRYDTYCYSGRYDSVPSEQEDVYTCLKRYDMLRIPKRLMIPKTKNSKENL